jgi:hypothetical protein
MSKQTKRDATEAFGKDDNAAAASKKRTRRKTKHKDSETPVAVPRTTTQESVPSIASTSIVSKAESSQIATEVNLRALNAPAINKGLSKGSEHKREHQKSVPHSENKMSASQSYAVTKNADEGEKHRTRESKRRAKKSAIEKGKDRSSPHPKAGWTKSIVGGHFLDQDPLLSQDEQ